MGTTGGGSCANALLILMSQSAITHENLSMNDCSAPQPLFIPLEGPQRRRESARVTRAHIPARHGTAHTRFLSRLPTPE